MMLLYFIHVKITLAERYPELRIVTRKLREV
jgi:hypothetical protein